MAATTGPETATPATAPADTTVGTTPFTIEVSLSAKARDRLAMPPDSIIVSAAYFADPTPATGNQANDVDQIGLGRAQAEVPTDGTVAFDGNPLQQDRLGLVQSEPQVNINVYSGRKSSSDNPPDCGMFQDSLAVAAKAPIEIGRKLIPETP